MPKTKPADKKAHHTGSAGKKLACPAKQQSR